MAPELALRPATPADANLIRHDWFLSYRNNGSKDVSELRPDVYNQQNILIEQLLAECPPIVATFPQVPDEIVGWVCRDLKRPIIHFVYVKYDYRRTGIGSALVAGANQHTHKTRAGELLFRPLGNTFNPYSLYRGFP